jgi:type I restriction enzyme S subunit
LISTWNKFQNGDTLFARITPCLENGKCTYVDILDNNEVAFGSTEFIVLREKLNVSTSQFIYYLAISPDFRDIAIQLMTGSSGRQRVETNALKEKLFLLPTLPSQRAIAEVLSSLDDKINLLTRQNATLEALAQTYFRQWFVEDNNNSPLAVSEIVTLENNSINPARQPLTPFYHYSIPAFDDAQTPAIELGKTILSNKFVVPPDTILVSKLNPITPRIWRIDDKVKPNSVCSTEFQVLRNS